MAEYRSTGKELRKSPKGLIAAILAFTLLAGSAYGVSKVLSGMETLLPEVTEPDVELDIPEVEDESSEDPDAVKYGRVIFPEERVHQGSLVLVNRDYPIEDAQEGIVSVFEQRNEYLAVRDMEVYLLDEPMLELNRMAKDFYEATGLSDLLVLNGYITKDAQKQLYEADLQRTGAGTSDIYAMPGCSEFESGYAFELGLLQNGMFMDFTAEDDHAWILKHCAEYGFVQRYPEGKSEFTHEENKPWVFRYVGVPHAWYMYKNNLCLEEYVELLELHPFDGEHCRIYDSLHRAYDIYYVPLDLSSESGEAEVPMPIGYTYGFSGNNKHGFYVTVSLGFEDDFSAPESSYEQESSEEIPADSEESSEIIADAPVIE